MSGIDKRSGILVDDNKLENLYQIYMRVQSGDKAALNELFQTVDNHQIHRLDVMNKEYQMSHMDNVLDSEFVLDNEKNIQEKEWIDSAYSSVSFRFSCLNKMLYKKKKKFLSNAKNTGYENGKKLKNSGNRKYYEGEYDISDFCTFGRNKIYRNTPPYPGIDTNRGYIGGIFIYRCILHFLQRPPALLRRQLKNQRRHRALIADGFCSGLQRNASFHNSLFLDTITGFYYNMQFFRFCISAG